MPRNGYWVECIPLPEDEANQNLSKDLYSASVSSFPELTETAPSPDLAIEKLRTRLKSIRQQYTTTGDRLPEMDNPVRPPTRLRAIQGWISVYINLGEPKGVRTALFQSLVALTSAFIPGSHLLTAI